MRWKSSQVAAPNTSHQKRARRSGSAQSKVTWNLLIAGIGAPYRVRRRPHRSFPEAPARLPGPLASWPPGLLRVLRLLAGPTCRSTASRLSAHRAAARRSRPTGDDPVSAPLCFVLLHQFMRLTVRREGPSDPPQASSRTDRRVPHTSGGFPDVACDGPGACIQVPVPCSTVQRGSNSTGPGPYRCEATCPNDAPFGDAHADEDRGPRRCGADALHGQPLAARAGRQAQDGEDPRHVTGQPATQPGRANANDRVQPKPAEVSHTSQVA